MDKHILVIAIGSSVGHLVGGLVGGVAGIAVAEVAPGPAKLLGLLLPIVGGVLGAYVAIRALK